MANRRGRVLVFVHDLRASGVVRNTLAIAARVAREHQVVLVARNDDGLLKQDVRGAPFCYRALFPGSHGSTAAAALRLRRLVREWKPDVLLSSGNRGHVVARLALLGLKRPLRLYRISNSLETGRRDLGLRAAWARLLAADSDTLFIVGEATARSSGLSQAVASGRAIVVTNGVDRDRARQLAAAPAPVGYPGADLPLIVSVGRLAPQKDFPTLIRAAALAARTKPLRLAIVGKGEPAAGEALRSVATEFGLGEQRFLLAGESDNVFAWLARASVFVLPSLWEGSSMALLEALAVDVPIVATRQAGDAAHVLDDGRYGLLIDSGDVQAMASAILRQLSDPLRPGDRADMFTQQRTLDTYAARVNAAVARASRG